MKGREQKGGNFQTGEEQTVAGDRHSEFDLSAEQESEAQRIYERLAPLVEEEMWRLSRALAGKKTGELFGKTEYEVRDRVHGLGAKALEVAVQERQKKGRVRGC
jgi:hypothetical protein